MKTTLILLCLFILLAGCTPITCNQPYIIKGKECCLDLDANSICDVDEPQAATEPSEDAEDADVSELAEPVTEGDMDDGDDIAQTSPTTYTKDISQMALLTTSLEAGYVLKRDSSGKIYKYKESLFDDLKLQGLVSAFKWSYEKQADEKEEDRSMNIYMFKFNSEAEADQAFGEFNQQMKDSAWYKKTKDFYRKEAYVVNEYSFNKFNWHVKDFKEKNVITRIYFQTAPDYDPEDEISLYQKRITDAIKRTEIITPDILPTKIALAKTKSNTSISMELKSDEKKLNIKPSDEYDYLTYLPTFVNDKDKIHLYLEIEIKNNEVEDVFKNERGITIGKGFSPEYGAFELVDQDGNIYYSTYYSTYIQGYRDTVIEKKNVLRQKIVFPIFRSADEFSIKAYDQEGNQVGSLKFTV